MLDLEAYRDIGYLLVPGVIPPAVLEDFIAVIERRVDELATQLVAAGDAPRSYEELPFERRLAALYSGRAIDTRAWDSLLFCRELCEVIRHPTFTGVLEPFLGPEIVYQGNGHLRPHLPGRLERLPWHQDAQFYGSGTEQMTNQMMQVWIPLVDATVENGCLAFVPGSHRDGLLEAAVAGETNVTRSTHDQQERIYRSNGSYVAGRRVVEVPMRRGDVIVFNSLTMHTGLENRSETVRWSMDLRFEAALGSRPLTDGERRGYEVMHQRIRGRKYVPLRVRSRAGAETWEDWQRRREELMTAC